MSPRSGAQVSRGFVSLCLPWRLTQDDAAWNQGPPRERFRHEPDTVAEDAAESAAKENKGKRLPAYLADGSGGGGHPEGAVLSVASSSQQQAAAWIKGEIDGNGDVTFGERLGQ